MRTAITPQPLTAAGSMVQYEPANPDGNSVRLGSPRILHVRNGSASPITVTLKVTATVAGLKVANRTVKVGAGEDRLMVLDDVLRQPDDFAYIDYSADHSVTVAALALS